MTTRVDDTAQPEQSAGQRDLFEARLQPMTARLRAWSQTLPSLREAIGGPPGLERILARAEHVLLPFSTGELHLEVHAAGSGGGPAVIFVPGIGAYVRFQSAALGAFRDAGIHAIGLDLPGHGLSGGRRGHAPVDVAIDAIQAASAYASDRFGAKVGFVGHSWGGIMGWCALTRTQPVADAVVCAGTIAHPQVLPTRQARLRAPVVRRIARAAPHLSIPIGQIAPFKHVALSPEILDFFKRKDDEIWCWRYTISTLASFLEFRPERDWVDVQTPALIVIGDADRMTSADAIGTVLSHARPPHAELTVMPGAGHMLFHEHLPDTMRILVPWIKTQLT